MHWASKAKRAQGLNNMKEQSDNFEYEASKYIVIDKTKFLFFSSFFLMQFKTFKGKFRIS